MITSPILEDKWRVQKALSEQAGDDPGRYIALAHEKARELQERFGIRFRYAEEVAARQSGLSSEDATFPLAADGEHQRR